ncbi:hypothetical protein L596_013121 [Steinernema carpocapsae]|uniref:Uncharacterized protein n=1 Tax=Steinernema carpocapsae TaxID=34508 RepID=A0A4U5P034_STECR|nr:hypothetical protein L596_013121 [Steinernema carpocapsae]
MSKYGSRIEYSSSYRSDFERIINDAASVYPFPMVLMMSVFYDYDGPAIIGYPTPTTMSYAGVYWPTNGNSKKRSPLTPFNATGLLGRFVQKLGRITSTSSLDCEPTVITPIALLIKLRKMQLSKQTAVNLKHADWSL